MPIDNRTFVTELIKKVEDGIGFVPFVGSGVSQQSGIMIGSDIVVNDIQKGLRTMRNTCLFLLAGNLFASATASAGVIVPGTADMWLAGMPDGATATSGDVAPKHSPVLVHNIDLTQGSITFTKVVGGALHFEGCPDACTPPEGDFFIAHAPGAMNGMSGTNAPVNALMGVFLGKDAPIASDAPEALDFATVGTHFPYLKPKLKQVFYIGNGRMENGELQTFYVPEGATRLYLGTMDGYGWYNNSGAIEVEFAPVKK